MISLQIHYYFVNSHQHENHSLGRLRFSLTDDPDTARVIIKGQPYPQSISSTTYSHVGRDAGDA